MTWGQPLGLDELMVINPGLPSSENYFLGDDGAVYQLQEIEKQIPELGELFLGDDGTLYQLQNYRGKKRRRVQRRGAKFSRRRSHKNKSNLSGCRCHRRSIYN